jgi:Holliday junction resolvase-like predicted endonuclease
MGAVSELIACADLLRHGYEVFRSVSPTASCDLMALKNGQAKRVEVKTAYRTKNGEVTCGDRKKLDKSRFDVLALVVDGVPVYEPPLDEPHIQ